MKEIRRATGRFQSEAAAALMHLHALDPAKGLDSLQAHLESAVVAAESALEALRVVRKLAVDAEPDSRSDEFGE